MPGFESVKGKFWRFERPPEGRMLQLDTAEPPLYELLAMLLQRGKNSTY